MNLDTLYTICFVIILIGLMVLFDATPSKVIRYIVEKKDEQLKRTARQKRALIVAPKPTRYTRFRDDIRRNLKESGMKLDWSGFVVRFCAVGMLGLVTGFLLDNIILGVALVVALPVAYVQYIKIKGVSYRRYLDNQIEDALGIITNAYINTKNLQRAFQNSIGRIAMPIHEIIEDCNNDLLLGANSVIALNKLRARIKNRYWQEWCDIMIRCQHDSNTSILLMPVIKKMSAVRKVQDHLDTQLKEVWTTHIMLSIAVFAMIPLLWVMNKEWFTLLVDTTVGKAVIAIGAIIVFVVTIIVVKINKPVSMGA